MAVLLLLSTLLCLSFFFLSKLAPIVSRVVCIFTRVYCHYKERKGDVSRHEQLLVRYRKCFSLPLSLPLSHSALTLRSHSSILITRARIFFEQPQRKLIREHWHSALAGSGLTEMICISIIIRFTCSHYLSPHFSLLTFTHVHRYRSFYAFYIIPPPGAWPEPDSTSHSHCSILTCAYQNI